MAFKIDVTSTPRQSQGQTVGTNSYIIERLNNSLVTSQAGGTTIGDDLVDDGLLFDFDVGNTSSYPGSGTTITDIKGLEISTLPIDIALSYDPGNSSSYSSSGSTITDLSGKLNNGTLVGSTYSSSEGGFFTLNGITGAITTANEIINPQTFSVGVWFKTTSNRGKIVGFSRVDAYDRQLYLASDGKVNCGIYDPTNALSNFRMVVSPTALNDGLWHYVVYTYASNVLKLYVDGIFVNSVSGAAQAYNGRWEVGGYYGGWPDSVSGGTFFGYSNLGNFAGGIGAFHVYNVELTASQIKQNFNAHCERKGVASALDGPWTSVSTTSTYIEQNAVESDRYYFRSRYTQSDGRVSPYSDPINVVAGSQTLPPAAPTFTLTPASTSVTINITGSAGIGHRIKDFTIQKFVNGSWTDLVTQTGISYVDSGLIAQTSYQYRIKLNQENGISSDFSSSQSITTSAAATLSAPTVSLSVNSSTQITVNIIAAPLSGSTVSSYIIERSINQSTWTPVTVSSTASTYAYADTGLTASTTYYYRVRFTTTTSLTSPYSSIVNATTDAAVAPIDIVSSGLLFAYDPANVNSYVGSGSTITDINPNATNPVSPDPVTSENTLVTSFSGLTWTSGYDSTSQPTGKNKSYILTGTDTITNQTFSESVPKLWGGVTSRNHELQLICGTTRTETPDQLFTREFLPTGGPSGTPCLRITKNYDYIGVDQASFRWFSDSNLVDQGMCYVRLKLKIDPAGMSDLGFLALIEVKYNNYDSGGDKKLELAMNRNLLAGKWSISMSSVRGNGGRVWGNTGTNTPDINSNPSQEFFFANQYSSTYGSLGPIISGDGNSEPEWGKWWTIEFAFRMKDANAIVAGNGSDGWVWAATSQGTTTEAAANGTGTQRFYIPGQNMTLAANKGAWCVFPFMYYTDASAGKYIDFASVEVYDEFPADATPRTGTAVGIG
jgi:hypothetical protein